MDKRNLIFGKPPEIGNVDHIIEYKRRAKRNSGELPLKEIRSFYTFDRGFIRVWRCPKCANFLESNFYENWAKCYCCSKEFELRADDKGKIQIFVMKEEDTENIT